MPHTYFRVFMQVSALFSWWMAARFRVGTRNVSVQRPGHRLVHAAGGILSVGAQVDGELAGGLPAGAARTGLGAQQLGVLALGTPRLPAVVRAKRRERQATEQAEPPAE